MATTTNYGWTTPDDTALVKDGAAAIRSLGTSVDTTTKALNPSTTLGDIEYRSSTANTNTRLAIGSTGNILTVSGGVPTWAAPAAGGGLTLISETVASGLSSLSFTSLGSYKQLLLMWAGVRHSANGSAFTLRFNNNSTAGAYITSGASFIDSTVNTSMASNDSLSITAVVAKYAFGENASLTSDAHNSGGCILLDNYTSATKSKTYTAEFGYYNDTDGKHLSINCSGYFGSQTAVTSIDIVRLTGSATFSNINNTTIRLYGVQ